MTAEERFTSATLLKLLDGIKSRRGNDWHVYGSKMSEAVLYRIYKRANLIRYKKWWGLHRTTIVLELNVLFCLEQIGRPVIW